MTFKLLTRLVGAIALTLGLAGCMDVTMEIDVQSETTGKATTTSVMGTDVYAMMKAGASSEDTSEGFCEEAGAKLTENDDGSATCVIIVEGAFDQLANAGTDDGAKFEVVSPGVVKVSFSTAEMKGQIGADDAQDEETKAMMKQFFEGHAITLRITGKEILDTNMTKSANGAEVVIPFLDLINGTINLPPELYATVKVN